MSYDLWLNDMLHDIIGFTDKTTVEYIKSVAKTAKTAQLLADELENIDFPSKHPKAFSFLQEVIVRNKALQPLHLFNEYELDQKKKMELQKRNQQFLVLGATEAEKQSNQIEVEPQKKVKTEAAGPPQTKEEIEKDLKDRQELHYRMLEKEKERRNKEQKPKNPNDKSLTLMGADRENALEAAKKKSRYSYLEVREKKQLDQYKRRLEDEEKMFEGVELTERERRTMELNKKTLKVAMEQAEINEKDQKDNEGDFYRPPEGFEDEEGHIDMKKKHGVLNERYKDVAGPPRNDQDEWEEGITKKATANTRTKDILEQKRHQDLGLVFANQIEFLKQDFLKEQKEARKRRKAKKNEQSTSEEEEELLPKLEDPEQQEKQFVEEVKTEMQKVRESLPIFKYRTQLLQLIRDNRVIIMVGETGSGKTTQLPQYLNEIGYTKGGKVGCTQPRRVAAMSVAARVASEMGVKLGHEVGYSIRFEECSSEKTVIKYMTDGMLLKEFMMDPTLSSYKVIIVDEAHERTLHTDVILSLIKDLSRARDDLKVIISSATLDAKKFSDYFDQAPIILIPGRRFQVDIFYTKAPESDYVEAAVVTVLQIHVTQEAGDILVFLTGQEEIEQAQELLMARTKTLGNKLPELIICPIYATLPSEQQVKIFEPTPKGARKVVIATNIAETSITIENILFVIDCGFCKQTTFNPRTGMESLQVVACSKANANQRAGRAGRVAPGKCFRLFTLWSFDNEIDDNTIPEIQRTNLGNVVLLLKTMGINNLVNFDFMDPPPHEMLLRALEQLYALGALNDNGDLTKLGRRMAEFPLDPLLAKTLVTSEQFKCVDQIITICSMLSVGNAIFYRPKEKQVHADNAKKNFYRPGGDHLTLLNVYNQWRETNFSNQFCFEAFIQLKSMKRARDIKEQLTGLCERVEIDVNNPELSLFDDEQNTNIRKCLTAGFFYNAAKHTKNGIYRTLKNCHEVQIHPSSTLFKENPEWVIYSELVYTSKEFMRTVCEIKPAWLIEIAPHYFNAEMLQEKSKNIRNVGQMAAQVDVNKF